MLLRKKTVKSCGALCIINVYVIEPVSLLFTVFVSAINHAPWLPRFLMDQISLYIGCYDIMPVRKEEGKSYWKIPLCDDDATREK